MTTEITVIVNGPSATRHCTPEMVADYLETLFYVEQYLADGDCSLHNILPNVDLTQDSVEVESVTTDFATEEQTKEHGCMFWFTAECTVSLSVSGGEQ